MSERPLDPSLMAAADLLDLGAGTGNRLAREVEQFGRSGARGSDDPTILPASAPPNQRKVRAGGAKA